MGWRVIVYWLVDFGKFFHYRFSWSFAAVPLMAEIELTIVIPAFNEEQRIGETLRRVVEYLRSRGTVHEILVVDDGSRDATVTTALVHAGDGVRVISLGHNQGKGAALKRGVLESRGNKVLISDADLSTPIAELEVLEPYLAEAALVFGSRSIPGAHITRRQPFYRQLMGKTFNKLIWLAGVRGFKDTQCGFKLMNGAAARRLFGLLVTPGFAFDVELAWLARQLNVPAVEVGVRWHNSPQSKVHLFFDPPRMLLEVLRFRWLHRREGFRI